MKLRFPALLLSATLTSTVSAAGQLKCSDHAAHPERVIYLKDFGPSADPGISFQVFRSVYYELLSLGSDHAHSDRPLAAYQDDALLIMKAKGNQGSFLQVVLPWKALTDGGPALYRFGFYSSPLGEGHEGVMTCVPVP